MADQGLKVAVVEKSPLMYGGTCINIACIPTKALEHMAHLVSQEEMDHKKKAFFRFYRFLRFRTCWSHGSRGHRKRLQGEGGQAPRGGLAPGTSIEANGRASEMAETLNDLLANI
ncbi:hypothetical protein [Paenibacillus sp. A14]|uniref:hypothetical protein n=1 Tax=Paenibacillus sp. A14 TaxID=3119820 RepID=UPI002FDFFF29